MSLYSFVVFKLELVFTKSIYKAVVVGESGVGKTSLIQRFISSSFDPNVEPSSRYETQALAIWRLILVYSIL